MVDKSKALDLIVDPTGKFKKALIDAGKKSKDLRVPFRQITESFYKTNMILFTFTSKGPFKELSPMYQIKKDKKWGFIWPILKASGKLERSLTKPTDPDTVATVINKTTLMLGTKVTSKKGAPYPVYLQTGTKKMPARPYLVVGTEKGNWAKSQHIQRRKQRWMELLEKYCADSLRLKKGKK